MFTVISLIFGFLSSSLPHVLNYYQSKIDGAQELAVMDLQFKISQTIEQAKLDALIAQYENATNDLIEQNATIPIAKGFVNSLNGAVRFILAVGLLSIYTYFKISSPFYEEEDYMLLSCVVGFYFGQMHFNSVIGSNNQ